MSSLVPTRLAAFCGALALTLLFAGVATAAAKKVEADIRVIGSGGKVLAEDTVRTGPTKVPTGKKATCFGRGTGGSGKRYPTRGPTALGLLADASKSDKALRPLLVTDAFVDEFGLGICSVGSARATSRLSWYLKVNHKNPNRGGEKVKVRKGDEVLWALACFPYPVVLSLTAPDRARSGVPFEVSVYSYDDRGKRTPAAGASVTGAAAPTDNRGRATVTLTAPRTLRATHGKDLPSNGAEVCLAGTCPRG
jgi:hypothetical protein